MAETQGDALFNKAKKYSSLKYTLTIIDTVFSLVLLLLFAGLGISKALSLWLLKFSKNNFIIVPQYLFLISLGYYLLSLPLNFYSSHILEHKFSLSNQKMKDWLNDQAKAGIVFYLIALILVAAFYYILRHFPRAWWMVISLFWIFFSLVLARLAPVVIIPLFFKYKRLSDDTLRERIMSLANRMKIKVLDCFEIDFSKKTLKGNAAFVGWGKTRRVILADTLKDKYSYDEIEVILAHEFAHYRLRHLFKLILINSLAIILSFYLIFITSDNFLSLFGLSSLWDIAAMPIIFIYFFIFGIIMQPFENYISRRLERNADALALKLTNNKAAFISMMDKIASQNLADRNPHPLIKFFFFDHPSVDERIAMANRFYLGNPG